MDLVGVGTPYHFRPVDRASHVEKKIIFKVPRSNLLGGKPSLRIKQPSEEIVLYCIKCHQL